MLPTCGTNEKPVRNAKAVAKLKLLGHTLESQHNPVPAPTVSTKDSQQAAWVLPQDPPQPQLISIMAGVSTQTDDLPQPGTSVVQPSATPQTPNPEPATMEALHTMMKELSAKVDWKQKTRSLTRSGTGRKSRPRRRSKSSQRATLHQAPAARASDDALALNAEGLHQGDLTGAHTRSQLPRTIRKEQDAMREAGYR